MTTPTYTLLAHIDYDKRIATIEVRDAADMPVAEVPISLQLLEQLIPPRAMAAFRFPAWY